MSALYAKLHEQFTNIINNVRGRIYDHIHPILMYGKQNKGDTDEKLVELYDEWLACTRALNAAVGGARGGPSQTPPMPCLPPDDKEHKPCRQMAVVLIQRNIYGEHYLEKDFHRAARTILVSKKCSNHPSSCACREGLKGWNHVGSAIVHELESFYKNHYDKQECSFCGAQRDECGEDHGDDMREWQKAALERD